MLSPIVTATLQATAIATVSNTVAQFLARRVRGEPLGISLLQLFRFVAFILLTAPLNYLWQHLLERTFPGRQSSPSSLPHDENEKNGADTKPRLNWTNTAIKWFIDCMTVGALLNTVAFIVIMGLFKGRPLEQIYRALQTETIPIISASYKIWPFASVINFTLIPVEKRIVFLSAVGFGWDVYMSWVAARQ